MAIKIPFVSDVSQVVRDMSTLSDRLDEATGELRDMGRAGEDAGAGVAEAGASGKDLDRVRDGADDAARGLEETADAAEGAARHLEDAGDSGRSLEDVADGADRAGAGLEDAAESADKTADSLGEVGDAGGDVGKSMREVGDDVERMAEGAGDSVDTMDDKVKRAFDNMSDTARRSTGKIGDSARRDFKRAGNATETFKDEAKQNLSETLSSFDGSLEGMVDGLQGTLGGVVGDLGVGGVIGAGAIAAGIGVGMAYADKVAEGINEQGEIASALAEEIRDAGGAIDDVDFVEKMTEWGTAIQDTREKWELWQDEAESGFEDAADLAEGAGVAFETAFDGMAGTLDDSKAALEEVNTEIRKLNEADKEGYQFTRTRNEEEKVRLSHLKDLRGEIESNIETQEQALEIEELRADAIGVTVEQLTDQIETQEELSGVITDGVEAELDYLETLDKSTERIAENGKTLDKDTEAGRDNRRALIDIRDSIFDYAEAQIEAGEATDVVSDQLGQQRNAFVDAAEAAGYTEDQAEDLADAYGLIPGDVITNVSSRGVSETKRDLNGIDRDIYTNVWVRESGAYAARQRIRQKLSGVQVTVQVNPHLSYKSAW